MHLAILSLSFDAILVIAAGRLALVQYELAKMSCCLTSRLHKTSIRLCAPAAGLALSSRSSRPIKVNCKVSSQMAPGNLLANKVCVITGGGRGIGAAIAERFAAEGASLVLTARSEEQLQKVAHSCKAKGAASCDVLPVDLSKSRDVEKFAKDVLGKHKQVDVLVNNAGMGAPGQNSPLSDPGDFAHWQKLLMTNTLAPMILTNLFALGMADRRSGLIINIASVASLSPMPETAVYATSKWGLRGWSLSCYEVLRHHDVKVVLINPGPVATQMTEGRMDPNKASTPDDVAQMAMMALTLAPQSVPLEMTMNTTEPADPSQ